MQRLNDDDGYGSRARVNLESGQYRIQLSSGWNEPKDADKTKPLMERFINDEPDPILRKVVALSLDFLKAMHTKYFSRSEHLALQLETNKWGRCDTVDERAEAVRALCRGWNMVDMFRMSESMLVMTGKVLDIAAENFNTLGKDEQRCKYTNYVNLHLLSSYGRLLETNDDGPYSMDDFLIETMIQRPELFKDVRNMGTDVTIDPPEDLYAADVALAVQSMVKQHRRTFDPMFALETRPHVLGLRKAVSRLDRLMRNERNDDMFGSGDVTWAAVSHDWTDKDVVAKDSYSDPRWTYAIVSMLEDGDVRPEKVDVVLDVLFPLHVDTEGDVLRNELLYHDVELDSDAIIHSVMAVARNGDVGLLKALAWLAYLYFNLRKDKECRRGYDISYKRLMSALCRYDSGIPLTFLIETMKGLVTKHSEDHGMVVRTSITMDESDTIGLYDWPRPWSLPAMGGAGSNGS